MRNIYVLLAFLLTCFIATAQSVVSTDPQPRNAVLEEFTGINCVNCPDGHVRAQALVNAHPGRVVWINIHSGSFAVPSGTQPDFRTPYGDVIDNFAGVAAYPSGDMNRLVWPGAYNQPPYYPQNPPGNMAIRRPGWWDVSYPGQGAGEYIILNGGQSAVNIGSWTEWNDVNRELTIHVELYYTLSDTDATNMLNVALTENNIIAYQSGGSANYNHVHMLRDLITGQWGESVSPVTQGTLISKTYVYTVLPDYNIDNCDINIFVTRSNNTHTHSGVVFPAKNGSTVSVKENITPGEMIAVYPNPAVSGSMISLSVSKPMSGVFELFNNAGEKVGSKEVQATRPGLVELPLSELYDKDLAAGIYSVSFTSGELVKYCKLSVAE